MRIHGVTLLYVKPNLHVHLHGVLLHGSCITTLTVYASQVVMHSSADWGCGSGYV